MKRVLIVGSGDVAARAIPWLVQRFKVIALTRRPDVAPALRALGACALLGDLDDRGSLERIAGIADAVLHFAPPPALGQRDTRTTHLLAALASRGSLPQRLVYISTSGVYGDCGGEWVDETRPCKPRNPRAIRRVDAEAQVRRFGRRHGVAVSILRAPGIYASDRLPIERLTRADPVLASDDDVFTNHIHADDLARLSCIALFRARPGRVINASDQSCLKMGDYFDLVADSFALPRPPRVPRSQIGEYLSPITLSFMGESRRLDNRRIGEDLRIQLRFPTVADGLSAARASVTS